MTPTHQRLTAIFLAAASCALASAASALTPAEQTGMVAAHNQWRREAGVPDVQWSASLAASAQTGPTICGKSKPAICATAATGNSAKTSIGPARFVIPPARPNPRLSRPRKSPIVGATKNAITITLATPAPAAKSAAITRKWCGKPPPTSAAPKRCAATNRKCGCANTARRGIGAGRSLIEQRGDRE